jgi:hypothetical protein
MHVAVAFVALLFAGCSQQQPFHFDVTADMRGETPPARPGPQYFEGVCLAIRDTGRGAFMISPGDIDPPQRVRATLDSVLGADYIWYPVVGNHEGEKASHMEYLREYNAGGRKLPNIVRAGPPGAVETCYSFDYGQAHFVVINQYYDGQKDMATDGNVPDPLYNWLAEDLAANTRPVIFVIGHEPAVAVPDMDSGRVRHRGDSLDKYESQNHRFWTLLKQHNVTAYICGHTHNASLARINGVWQIDAGHARGLGDKEAASTFMKFHVLPEGVRCDVYRLADEAGRYQLTHSEWLKHD